MAIRRGDAGAITWRSQSAGIKAEELICTVIQEGACVLRQCDIGIVGIAELTVIMG